MKKLKLHSIIPTYPRIKLLLISAGSYNLFANDDNPIMN